ncbi:MAG TPA: CRISPR-associated endonuclease Cas2 [Candidatus Paceibacterota bacterium]|nr:CRISPR-associated endonuclease Cas2 [Candidatus Paceibacterota bacterium]
MAKTQFKGIKTLAEYRRGELTKDILRLVGAGVKLGAIVTAPNLAQVIDYLDPKGRNERNRIWKAIKYLESKERVRIVEKDGTQILILTHQGKQKLDEVMIWELEIRPPRRWDKKWRLVMFDFPEHRTTAHQSFRQRLLELGFQMYQQSVLIYPHECRDEVQAIAHWFHVGDRVRYVVATEINDARRYAKAFHLLEDHLTNGT